jgi:nicotinate-nucleotide pyrophosphorylase (carboxylating)
MNNITMKMQADELIRMALQEDITSEDVSANSIMKKPQLRLQMMR